jgi:branched-chain amino acid transport system ATP-binding protein
VQDALHRQGDGRAAAAPGQDEPSAGLSALFVSTVITSLAALRGEGISMLIAEQNVKLLKLGDRVFTMEEGGVGFCGTPTEIAADDDLRRAYFGLGI